MRWVQCFDPFFMLIRVRYSAKMAQNLGSEPIDRYEVYRREEKIATMPYRPQLSEVPFAVSDDAAPQGSSGGLWYRVRVVDAAGRTADSISVKPV